MVTREITITLPDDIAQAAEERGLLTPEVLEQIIRAEVGRREHQRLRVMMDELSSLDEPPLTNEELNAEIRAARAERRAKRAPGD